MENIVSDIQSVINSWETLGSVAGLIALLQLLIKSLKFKPVNELFKKYKIKWTKPYIAITLGAIAGALSAYSTNTSIPSGALAGLITGLASVGWNETINKVKSSKRGK